LAIDRFQFPRIGLIVAIFAAIGIPFGLVFWAGWQEVVQAMGSIGVIAIIAALLTSLSNYFLRFARWQYFMKALGHSVPWRHNLQIYFSGLALTATPGKAGELVRGLFLKPYGVSYARSFVLFFWDRLSDLAGVLLLAVTAGGLLASGYQSLLPGVLVVLFLLWLLRPGGPLFMRTLLMLEDHLSRRARVHLRTLIRLRHVDTRLTLPLALKGVTAGTLAYAAHGIGLYIMAQAAGVPLELAAAILVVTVSTLMGAVVLMPGGVGMVELTSVVLLSAQGVPEADAVALGLVHRFTTFWFAIGLGAGCLIPLIRRR
jgi:uncharacterized protein (TIRG00374 family)